MSAMATTPHSATTGAGRQDSPALPIPFGRLVGVEARKLFDTRTGQILTALLVIITIGSIVARAIVDGPVLQTLLFTAAIGFSTLLPVLGILTVTGEWSHRTALTTFALEPRRGRVLLAKCLPAMITAVAASLLAVLVALPTTAIAAQIENVSPDMTINARAVVLWTVNNIFTVLVGLALGLALLNAPAAIVISLSTTVLLNTIGRFGDAGAAIAEWLDLSGSTMVLAGGHASGQVVAQLATAFAFWIVLPMAIGFVRVLHKEVN